ncbi:MAG: rhodanese-like domain-containing protein [Limnobacter sp.]|uniref:rhodanese-like domain-containing protein n=1 Tax=Limnobacter sp. TaxID=2003368 RepID=UPI0022C7AA0B|nr:rhodanese-like domain-containing protein [Limnobacter sp.]MCZ8014823.1 rhodanese-like domain-containing protein [Limnobacter sp.]
MNRPFHTKRLARDMIAIALLAVGVATATLGFAQELKPRALTPHKTFEMVMNDKNLLFVDVRDPIEIMFIGGATQTHVNVPFMFADRYDWDSKNSRFAMKRNPAFIEQVKKALDERGLDFTATIITICRSGSERGLPSAQYLIDSGFENAYYVDHGFQGDALKDGAQKGLRLVNGWQNSGLPWTAKLNADSIFRPR